MDVTVKEVYSPSKEYKAVILKRTKDGLFESQIYKWFVHDPELQAIPNSVGYWGIVHSFKSLADTEDRAFQIAIEELRLASREQM